MKTVYILLILVFSTLMKINSLFAAVNPDEGSFERTWVDVLNRNQPSATLEIYRYYNSRSLRKGLFGFGWCSQLEIYLKVKAPNQVELVDCRQSAAMTFSPRAGAVSDNKLKLWSSNYKSVLVKEKSGFRIYLPSDQSLLFNHDGQILKVDTPQSSYFIKYLKGKVHLLVTRERTYKIKYDNAGERITSISDTRHVLSYDYLNDELVKVQNTMDGSWHYEYDSLSNLVRFQDSSSNAYTIGYNNELDQVNFVRGPYDCQSDYSYKEENGLIQTKLKKTCLEDSSLQESSIDLSVDQRGRVVTLRDSKGTQLSFEYDDELRQPTKINHSQYGLLEVTYGSNGEITNINSANNLSAYAVRQLLLTVIAALRGDESFTANI